MYDLLVSCRGCSLFLVGDLVAYRVGRKEVVAQRGSIYSRVVGYRVQVVITQSSSKVVGHAVVGQVVVGQAVVGQAVVGQAVVWKVIVWKAVIGIAIVR